MTRRGLIHAHSSYSFDSLLPPQAYLWYAQRRGFDFLCLTDHNTIEGSLSIARRNRKRDLEIVVGAEYATDRGDLIGLFLSEEVQSRNWETAIDEIHRQGGLALLPHPRRGHKLDDEAWRGLDLVEAFNARSFPDVNRAGLEDAERHGLPQVVGTDCHTAWELLRGGTLVTLDGEGDLRAQLLGGPRSFETRTSSYNMTRYSRVVKGMRRRLGFPGRR